MKKNTVALAVAAAMTASLLVGCGGTAADSTSTAESTQHLRMLPLLQPPLPVAMRP